MTFETDKTYDGLPLRPEIRTAVRALIFCDNAILVQHKVLSSGREKYTLPGGGMDVGETLEEALRREVREEVGAEIEIKSLFCVADYFKRKSGPPPMIRQQVEHIFLCHVSDTYLPQNGSHPDKDQVNVLWLSLSDLPDSPFSPAGLKPFIQDRSQNPGYLGLIG